MSLLKALMLCLAMAMTITAPAHSEMTTAPQGGITDVLQIGRNAVVVTINRSLLSAEIRHEIALIILSDAQGNQYTYKCEGSVVLIPTAQLAPGTCTVRIRIGKLPEESHNFTR